MHDLFIPKQKKKVESKPFIFVERIQANKFTCRVCLCTEPNQTKQKPKYRQNK